MLPFIADWARLRETSRHSDGAADGGDTRKLDIGMIFFNCMVFSSQLRVIIGIDHSCAALQRKIALDL